MNRDRETEREPRVARGSEGDDLRSEQEKERDREKENVFMKRK